MVRSAEDQLDNDQKSRNTLSNRNLNTDPLWTVEDVATYLRLEPETVRSMTREGELPAFKVGRVWRYRHSEIKLWLYKQGNSTDIKTDR